MNATLQKKKLQSELDKAILNVKEGNVKNSIDTAKREGRIEANIETAQRLLAMGLPTEQVAKATQLPLDMVQNLSN